MTLLLVVLKLTLSPRISSSNKNQSYQYREKAINITGSRSAYSSTYITIFF
jgi:hypothetical protein